MRSVAQCAVLLRIYIAQDVAHLGWFTVNALMLPALLLYIGTRIAETPTQLSWWMGGAIGTTLALTSLGHTGFAVMLDKSRGRIELIQTTGVSRAAYYAAVGLVSVVHSIWVCCITLCALRLLGFAATSLEYTPAVVFTAALAGAALGGIGAAIGMRAQNADSAADGIATASFVLAVTSPLLYPEDTLPTALQLVSWFSPLTHIADCFRSLVAGESPDVLATLFAMGIAVVFHSAAYRMMQWRI